MRAVVANTLPVDYRDDVRRASRILIEGGCSEVFLFGSVPQGRAGERSDIDIAVRGCPASRFFAPLGELLMELKHPVDLVDLDENSDFGDRLVTEDRLFRVAEEV